jgi:membrane-bound metal-dependent hydrolase YbcI (DUF457 family)
MLPVEHFIVALLPILAYGLLRDRSLPSTRLLAVVFLGSQFPDLVDKPLAHQFGLIPSGRVFMHSLPFAIPVLTAIGYYSWKTGRKRLSSGFVAYLSHLLADNYLPLLDPVPTVSPDLLWPFVEPVPRSALPY